MTLTASAIDAAVFGEHRAARPAASGFVGRVTRDGSSGWPAEAGRYHLYGARTSPAAHRLELIRALAGLEAVVSVSHVDGLRDGRGWAFREPTGPDPVNGFTLLREAYEATVPGYTGEVRVPVLWDRQDGRIVSDDPVTVGIDLATQFGSMTQFGSATLYPSELADEIERVSASVASAFTDRLARAVVDGSTAAAVRSTLRRLDRHLAANRHLLGAPLTDADLRLWVALIRYDVGPNAHGAVGPALSMHRHLWRYTRELYDRPEFRSTTDVAAFAAPFSDLTPWSD